MQDRVGLQPPVPQGKTHHGRPEKWGVVEVPRGYSSFHAGSVVGSDIPLQACLTAWISSWTGILEPSALCSPWLPGSSLLSGPEQHQALLEHNGPFPSNCATAKPSKHCHPTGLSYPSASHRIGMIFTCWMSPVLSGCHACHTGVSTACSCPHYTALWLR